MDLINIKELITLFEIVDDYKSFNDDIKLLFNSDYELSWMVCREALDGKRDYIPAYFKNFIEKHENTIAVLKKNDMLNAFIPTKVEDYKEIDKKQKGYFHYLVLNKKFKDTIYNFLKRAMDIGIHELKICLSEPLSEKLYPSNNPSEIYYIENMEVELTLANPFTFSKEASYLITSKKTPSGNKNIIEVSTLVIDCDRLPNFQVSYDGIKEEINNKLIELQKLHPYFIPTMELNDAINNLKNKFLKLKNVTCEKDVFKNDLKLKNIVDEMENEIGKLEEYSTNMQDNLVSIEEVNKVRTYIKEKTRKND